jgi:hypothetical protein
MQGKNYARRSLENSHRANPEWVDVILADKCGVITVACVTAYVFLSLPVYLSWVLGAIL